MLSTSDTQGMLLPWMCQPHEARLPLKVAKAASEARKATALQRQERGWQRVSDTAQIKGTSWSHNSE